MVTMHRFRRVGCVIVGMVALSLLGACDRQEAQQPPASFPASAGKTQVTGEQISIGTVLPLTGRYSEYGQNVLTALQIAADEIKKTGGLQVRLIAEDDQAEPRQAVTALQKLISADKVKFVIGGFTSGSSQAMYPVAERAGVLMFSPSTSTPNLTLNTPLFFRNWPSDNEQARVFAEHTVTRFGKRTASILYSNSEYGVNAKTLFRQAYEAQGGRIVIEEAYEPKATDYRAQINRLMRQPTDCVWLFGYYNEMGHFLRQAREQGLRTQFFGQEGIEGQDLIDIAGEGAEGLIYFVPAFDANDKGERTRAFVEMFEGRLRRKPEVFAAHAYDALHILVDAITAVGSDPKAVAKQLITLRDYPGVAGLTTIDEHGDARKPVMIKTIRHGTFVPHQE